MAPKLPDPGANCPVRARLSNRRRTLLPELPLVLSSRGTQLLPATHLPARPYPIRPKGSLGLSLPGLDRKPGKAAGVAPEVLWPSNRW